MKEHLDIGYPLNPGVRVGERICTISLTGILITWTWDGVRWVADTIGVGTINPFPITYDFFGNPIQGKEPIDCDVPGYTKCDNPFYAGIPFQRIAEGG